MKRICLNLTKSFVVKHFRIYCSPLSICIYQVKEDPYEKLWSKIERKSRIITNFTKESLSLILILLYFIFYLLNKICLICQPDISSEKWENLICRKHCLMLIICCGCLFLSSWRSRSKRYVTIIVPLTKIGDKIVGPKSPNSNLWFLCLFYVLKGDSDKYRIWYFKIWLFLWIFDC